MVCMFDVLHHKTYLHGLKWDMSMLYSAERLHGRQAGTEEGGGRGGNRESAYICAFMCACVLY